MSKSSDIPSNGDSRTYAYQACMRMLRPVVALALRFGLKYHDLDAMAKSLLVEEASKELKRTKGATGEASTATSASQISVTTGIHRKEIRRSQEAESVAELLPSSERSISALVFALWLRKAHKKRIPVQATGRGLSFERLVTQTGKDVHFHSVLSELVRLGLVGESEGYVTRLQDDYVPQGADMQMMSLLADNVYAHVSAGVSNVCGNESPFLEQVVWANGFGKKECIEVQETARSTWHEARNCLLSKLEEVNPVDPPADSHRVRIGMYMYFEPTLQEGLKS